jgi:ribosomal protein S18 acetylase RimI-like enzyme
MAIQVLEITDIQCMRPKWEPRLDTAQMERIVAHSPGFSMWSPESEEVIVVGEWRRWPNIASVAGVHAVRDPRGLYRASIDQCRRLGADAFLTIEWDERQRPEFCSAVGLELLDVVIPFEAPSTPFRSALNTSAHLIQLDIRSSIDPLLDVDHAAFPWLWVNNAAEFMQYAETPGVEVWGHLHDGRLQSYVGFTYFANWGHIDRIAVHPDAQRRGLGTELMHLAMQRLSHQGSRTIGLSTQAGNWRSQRLYDRLGFRRTSINAYRVYGRVFRPALIDEFAPA